LCSEYALSGKTKTSHFQSKLNELEKERQMKEEMKNGRTDRDLTIHDFHIFLYNQAVVFYHQRFYTKSLDILKRLRDNVSAETSMNGLKKIIKLKIVKICYGAWISFQTKKFK